MRQALAQKLGESELRMAGLIAALRRILNVDGYSVLSVDDASSDMEPFAVLTAIKSLPESYREPFVLRLVEGMTGPKSPHAPGSPRIATGKSLSRNETVTRLLGGAH